MQMESMTMFLFSVAEDSVAIVLPVWNSDDGGVGGVGDAIVPEIVVLVRGLVVLVVVAVAVVVAA